MECWIEGVNWSQVWLVFFLYSFLRIFFVKVIDELEFLETWIHLPFSPCLFSHLVVQPAMAKSSLFCISVQCFFYSNFFHRLSAFTNDAYKMGNRVDSRQLVGNSNNLGDWGRHKFLLDCCLGISSKAAFTCFKVELNHTKCVFPHKCSRLMRIAESTVHLRA